jgi:hypothetical protein
MSPNYLSEVFEIPDREVLVVSTDVPPQAGEMDEHRIQRENANVVRVVCRQEEIDAVAVATSQPAGNVVLGAGSQPASNVVNG